jgi:hypothetical protein
MASGAENDGLHDQFLELLRHCGLAADQGVGELVK